MKKSESLLNKMENTAYKSAAYFHAKEELMAHLGSKASVLLEDDEDEVVEWSMTGPAPIM